MADLTLLRDAYRDKVYGGWIGKNIGSTLGLPVEGALTPNSLQFYQPLPGQATANDDLDFQLVWLHALRAHGVQITSDHLIGEWRDHIRYPWDEYGYALFNMRRSLRPPLTGAFENWFRHSLGGVCRTEIWAMVAPGAPQVAATYAWQDAILDHAEEGVWGAMFWAGIESAAFFLSDTNRLLDIGLNLIPKTCRVAQAVGVVREAHLSGASPLEARSRILQAVGSDNFTDTPQNIGFMALGWLYGEGDFGASICAAVNCGYAAGSNGASLGALLGILKGRRNLPAEWIDPIGDAIVVGWGVADLRVQRTAAELADHTVEMGEKVVAAKCPHVMLVDRLETPPLPPAAPVLAPSAPAVPDISAPEAAAPESPTETAEAIKPPPVAPAPSDRPWVPDIPAAPEEPAAAPVPDGEPPAPPETVVSFETAPTPESRPAPPADSNQRARFLELDDHAPAEPPSVVVGWDADAPASAAIPSEPYPVPSPAAPASPPISPTAPSPPVPAPTSAFSWMDSSLVKPLLVAPPMTATYLVGQFECVVDYGDNGPVIVPNSAISLIVTVRNLSATDFLGYIRLGLPKDWQVAVPGAQGQRQMLAAGRSARFGFVIRAPENAPLASRNAITLILSPEEGRALTCDILLLGGSCWHVVGPLTNQAEEGYAKVYPVEDKPGLENEYLGRGGGLIRWQRMGVREMSLPLEPLFAGMPGVAYLTTTLRMPVTTDARIVAHTNDGVKVWLNRQLIIQRHAHEPFRPTLGYGPAQADVSLRAGDNLLFVKAVRDRDPYALSIAVTDRDGQPLMDLGNTMW
jgi:ADP-ribosylglycohydrolase